MTGVPETVLFRQLFDAGMRYEDFAHLEYQNNPAIVELIKSRYERTVETKRMFRKKLISKIPVKAVQDDRETLWAYLDVWAGLIEEFHASNAPVPSPPSDAQLEKIELRELINK